MSEQKANMAMVTDFLTQARNSIADVFEQARSDISRMITDQSLGETPMSMSMPRTRTQTQYTPMSVSSRASRSHIPNSLVDLKLPQNRAAVRGRGREVRLLPGRRLLGKGSFGTTYEMSTDDGTKVVVKEIQKDLRSPEHYEHQKQRVRREAKILEAIQTECGKDILCYRGTIVDNDNYYIITESLDSYISLRDYLALLEPIRGTREWENLVLKVARNLQEALEHLHKLDVAHMDFKPENILIEPNTGKVKIIDFGEACIGDDCTGAEVGGTMMYTAPEILDIFSSGSISGTPLDIEARQNVDHFSLGLTLFELLSGTPWWRTSEAMRALRKSAMLSGQEDLALAMRAWEGVVPFKTELPPEILNNPRFTRLLRDIEIDLQMDPTARELA